MKYTLLIIAAFLACSATANYYDKNSITAAAADSKCKLTKFELFSDSACAKPVKADDNTAIDAKAAWEAAAKDSTGKCIGLYKKVCNEKGIT